MAVFLLLQDSDKLILQDGTGDLLLQAAGVAPKPGLFWLVAPDWPVWVAASDAPVWNIEADWPVWEADT